MLEVSRMSSVSFSSDGVEVISRQLETGLTLGEPGKSVEEIDEFYELERCSSFITDNGYHRIALQFPDSYLCDAARVSLRLRESTKQELFIMADTSYGSCCVDEVAAEHVGADCIIHYGPSCLTQTRRLPVLYVFGREAVDVDHCSSAFRQLFPDPSSPVIVLYDTSYSHCVDSLRASLQTDYPHCVFSSLTIPTPLLPDHAPSDVSMATSTRSSCDCEHGVCQSDSATRHCSDQSDASHGSKEQVENTTTSTSSDKTRPSFENDDVSNNCRFGRSFALTGPLHTYQVFYVGREGPTLTNLMLNYSQCQFHSYDPVRRVSRRESLNVNKALGRRYYLMQRAKEARTVGILVGTLGAASYLDSIQRLKRLLREAGKKYYTIAVGKLNVPKMANFLEIDVFVLVACPENSLLDSQEFFKPVVTPYEMEVACNRSRQWDGDYTTDFTELLPGAAFHVAANKGDEEEPEFSLISGGLIPSVRKTVDQDEPDESSTALVQRSKMDVALQKSAAASYLHSRSWQGLEQQLGQTDVTMATEGISGIAASYSHEPSTEN